ncbi:MAG: amino acid--tRNA ligase-related protein [Collinsella aerofaciens]
MTDIVSDVLGKQVTIDTPVEELAAAAREKGLEIKPEWTAGKIIAEIYDELGEDTIVNPTFVCDYPIEVSPLAKRFEDDPRLTHRFELVIAGHEYANAFSELNDPVDQAERFAAQMAEKAGGDDEAMEYDEDYVRASSTVCLPQAALALYRPRGHAAHQPGFHPRRAAVPAHEAREGFPVRCRCRQGCRGRQHREPLRQAVQAHG